MIPRLFDPGPEDESPNNSKARTVAELFRVFLSHAEATGRYSPRSLSVRQPVLDRFAATYGARSPETLKPFDLENWVHSQETWKSQATRRHAFDTVATVFAWGFSKELIDRNPFVASDRPKDGKRRDDMQPAEFVALIRVATPTVRRMLYFSGWTGCRPGELAAATWNQVDFTPGKEKIVQWAHKTMRKTGKPRIIPLTPRAVRLLKWMLARAADKNGPIFLTRNGTIWSKSHWVQTMQRMCDRAGIQRRTWHMIRHMFGTQRVRAGKPIKLISLAMGHSSVATTEKYYCHLDDAIEAMRGAMEDGPGKG